MKKLKKILTLKRISVALIVIGVLGISLSFFLYIRQPRLPQIVSNPKSVSVNSAPSSVKPTTQEIVSYSVPPNDPKYISIPAIDISTTKVLKLGLLKSGAIGTPDNVYDTGWYDGSSTPGQNGAMFIYGHVSSWTADGIFYNLKILVAGDKIIITRGDNTTYTYQVVSLKIYPYNNVPMNTVLEPIQAGTPGLNLMTCTGQVMPGTSEFNERLVVYTSLVSS